VHGALSVACLILVGVAFWRFGWKIGLLDFFLVIIAANASLLCGLILGMLSQASHPTGSKYMLGQARRSNTSYVLPLRCCATSVWLLIKSSALIVRGAVRPRTSAVAPQPF
jgi:hypothetical protein